MPDKVNAVFLCTEKKPAPGYTDGSVELRFSPPYTIDTKKGAPYDPATDTDRYKRVNDGWAASTPSGSVYMLVANPAAAAAFEQGEYYTATFEKFTG